MGGQACVFYGAAEFSRDCDVVILAEEQNLSKLQEALNDLQAECIAIPPLELQYLERGHSVHFRCQHPAAKGLRLDVMTRMRGCDGFASLWERRTSLQDDDGAVYELISVNDLVLAKKTQRDKDWPMIRRLVDVHFEEYKTNPTDKQLRFWFQESRSPEVLMELAAAYPDLATETAGTRSLLRHALSADRTNLSLNLIVEEAEIRAADQAYWQPLKAELEALRRSRRLS